MRRGFAGTQLGEAGPVGRLLVGVVRVLRLVLVGRRPVVVFVVRMAHRHVHMQRSSCR